MAAHQKIIEHIIVVGSANEYTLTAKIIERSALKSVQEMSAEEYEAFLPTIAYDDSKKYLALKVFPGSFARECPGTAEPYLCCGYEVLSPNVNCSIGCSYCILQCYLNEPVNIVYVNLEKAVTDGFERYATMPERLVRVGTGELGDSLSLEPWTQTGEFLLNAFKNKPNIIFELKSKAVCLGNLFEIEAPENIVLSWSLNPQAIVEKEEPFAASIAERLKAAKKAVELGYMVGFHFDPIIYVENGAELYRELVEQLIAAIPAERIAWISLGCLRFPGELLPIVRQYQSQSDIFSEEIIKGMDGKWRYPRPTRRKMYKWVLEPMAKIIGKTFVYLCMEKADLWHDVLGWAPEDNDDFDLIFTKSLKKRFSYFK